MRDWRRQVREPPAKRIGVSDAYKPCRVCLRAWANDRATWAKSICSKAAIRETASAQNRRMLVVKLNPN